MHRWKVKSSGFWYLKNFQKKSSDISGCFNDVSFKISYLEIQVCHAFGGTFNWNMLYSEERSLSSVEDKAVRTVSDRFQVSIKSLQASFIEIGNIEIFKY